jgi:hypothetical protein
VIRRRPSLAAQLSRLEATLEEVYHQITRRLDRIVTNQEHLDADISGLKTAMATVIAELKAQPGAGALDFTAADQLLADTQAEAATDAPPAPPA